MSDFQKISICASVLAGVVGVAYGYLTVGGALWFVLVFAAVFGVVIVIALRWTYTGPRSHPKHPSFKRSDPSHEARTDDPRGGSS